MSYGHENGGALNRDQRDALEDTYERSCKFCNRTQLRTDGCCVRCGSIVDHFDGVDDLPEKLRHHIIRDLFKYEGDLSPKAVADAQATLEEVARLLGDR